MKILFDKVGSSGKPFDFSSNGMRIEGVLKKSGYHRVSLNAQLSGDVDLDCDRCGDTFSSSLDGELKLSLSDEVLKDKDDLDIIEFLDGMIDISYLLDSEINAQKSTYNHCPKCDNSDEDFELEF